MIEVVSALPGEQHGVSANDAVSHDHQRHCQNRRCEKEAGRRDTPPEVSWFRIRVQPDQHQTQDGEDGSDGGARQPGQGSEHPGHQEPTSRGSLLLVRDHPADGGPDHGGLKEHDGEIQNQAVFKTDQRGVEGQEEPGGYPGQTPAGALSAS